MKTIAVIKALQQEVIWLIANLAGAAYYVVRTRQFLTPSYALGPNPLYFGQIVMPTIEVSLILNLVWAALVVRAIFGRRKTAINFVPILLAFLIWVGTILHVRSQIGRAIEDVRSQEVSVRSNTGEAHARLWILRREANVG